MAAIIIARVNYFNRKLIFVLKHLRENLHHENLKLENFLHLVIRLDILDVLRLLPPKKEFSSCPEINGHRTTRGQPPTQLLHTMLTMESGNKNYYM